jgi:hypothetical protein
MSQSSLSPPQLRAEGFRALVERLGLADAIRFIQQFHPGFGNYTSERQAMQAMELDEIVRSIQDRNKGTPEG